MSCSPRGLGGGYGDADVVTGVDAVTVPDSGGSDVVSNSDTVTVSDSGSSEDVSFWDFVQDAFDSILPDYDHFDVPVDKHGCNKDFFKPGCTIADIDIYGNKIAVLCRDLIPGDTNKKFFIGELGDPMTKQPMADFNATVDEMAVDYYGDQHGIFEVVPEQILMGGAGIYDGIPYVIFSGDGPTCLSGVSFNVDGEKFWSTINDFSYPALGKTYFRSCGVASALIADGPKGNEIWFPASLEKNGNKVGILRAYNLPQTHPFEFFGQDGNNSIVLLSGREPTAIAEVPKAFYDPDSEYRFAAVLNTMGYGDSIPLFGNADASIDIVRLNHLNPDTAVYATIAFGADKVFSARELPITDDGGYAFAVGEIDSKPNLIVANLMEKKIEALFEDDDLELGVVKDVKVRGSKLYIALANDAGGSSVYMYDISNPANPMKAKIKGTLDRVLFDDVVQEIEIDDGGTIYAVVPDEDEPGGKKSAVYAIDPEEIEGAGCTL